MTTGAWRWLICVTFLLFKPVDFLLASPLDDLGSPSPEIRTHAAEIIRDQNLYKTSSRKKWDKMVLELKEGDTTQDLSNFLRRNKLKPTFAFYRNAIYNIRLDDSWMLLCAVNKTSQDAPPLLTQFKIVERPKEVFVAPPPGFTGRWPTYRISGEPFGPDYYDQGTAETLF